MKTRHTTALIVILMGVFLFLLTPPAQSRSKNSANLIKVEENLESILETIRRFEGSQAEKDARVEKLFQQGQDAWRQSNSYKYPGFSENSYFDLLGVGVQSFGTIRRLYTAVIQYYTSTNRPAKAISFLEMAREDTKRFLMYVHYADFQEQLIDIYLKLGMIDRSQFELQKLQQELFDFYDPAAGQDPKDLDTDSLIQNLNFYALQLKWHFEANVPLDRQKNFQNYLFFKNALKTHPDLYRNILLIPSLEGPNLLYRLDIGEIAFHYSKLFAQQGKMDKAFEALTYARKALQYKMDFALNSKSKNKQELMATLDKYSSPETRVFLKLYFTFLVDRWTHELKWIKDFLGVTFTGKFEKPLKQRSYHDNSFRLHLYEAEIHYLAGDYTKAEKSLQKSKQIFSAMEKNYSLLPDYYRFSDEVVQKKMQMVLLDARLKEGTGDLVAAAQLYRQHIAISEKIRLSLPVKQRKFFFQSKARAAYIGCLRVAARIYQQEKSADNFNAILLASEAFRSRQLRELLNSDEKAGAQVDLSSLRSKMGPEAGIILFADLDNSLLVSFVNKDAHSAKIIKKDSNWDENIFALRNRLAEEGRYDYQNFAILGKDLFHGLEDYLSKTKHLSILNDGSLCSLPIGILPLANGQLLQDLSVISYLPSLALYNNVASASALKGLFAVADPAYDKESSFNKVIGKEMVASTRGSDLLGFFAPLPETRDEAAAISKIFTKGSNKILLGSKAAESAVKADSLTSYSHLHFATHGVIGGEVPDLNEPALVLSYETGQDGFLTASEVARLKLDADLTVLSACNTGNGKYFKGEGLMGIGRAFMVAGSKQVVVSLWPVESMATMDLMISFYQDLQKSGNPVAALATAKNKIRKTKAPQSTLGEDRGLKIKKNGLRPEGEDDPRFHGRANPFYWSPFIVISTGA